MPNSSVEQPDPGPQAQRVTDRAPEVRARSEAGDAPDHLTDHEPEDVAVVLVRGARLPQRLLVLDRAGHRRPFGDLVEAEHPVEGGDSRAVPEDHAAGDVLLALLRELRPVPADRGVEIQLPFLREEMGTEAHESLGAGEDRDDGVLFPRAPGPRVRDPAPQVDDLASAREHRDRRAEFGKLVEVPREHVGDVPESFVGPSVVLPHRVPSSAWSWRGTTAASCCRTTPVVETITVRGDVARLERFTRDHGRPCRSAGAHRSGPRHLAVRYAISMIVRSASPVCIWRSASLISVSGTWCVIIESRSMRPARHRSMIVA